MLILRSIKESDLNLVRDSFVRSVKELCSEMTNGLSHSTLRTLIDKAILYGWVCQVICDDSQQDEIMGWIVCQPSSRQLLWVYRKPRYKKMKIGQQLFEALFAKGNVNCAFINPRLTQGLLSRGYQCRLRPYITTEIMSYE